MHCPLCQGPFQTSVGRTYDMHDLPINEGQPSLRVIQGIETPYILKGVKLTIPMIFIVISAILSMNEPFGCSCFGGDPVRGRAFKPENKLR